jgi:hypothetical protein
MKNSDDCSEEDGGRLRWSLVRSVGLRSDFGEAREREERKGTNELYLYRRQTEGVNRCLRSQRRVGGRVTYRGREERKGRRKGRKDGRMEMRERDE